MNKPAHLLVHPSKPGDPPSLLEGLKHLLAFELATGGSLSIINRLDRETSGLVLIAKNQQTASKLGKAKQNRAFEKSYLAIVHGEPEVDNFSISAPICRKREVEPSEIYVRQTVHESGKLSESEFEVLERLDGVSLLKCKLLTGRTHQLRVHLEHAGWPIVGDKIYGHDGGAYLEFINTGWTNKLAKQLEINRQALHASELVWGSHRWTAPLPQELREFLKKKGAN